MTHSENITPAAPDAAWLATFLNPGLLGAPAFALATPPTTIKLDQNENPTDWPDHLKEKISARLMQMEWNRYPGAYCDDLADLVATYAKVKPGSVLLGPGSNYLITVLINTFGRNLSGDLVIARPSFALFEAHCRYEGIPCKPWELTSDLEYDPEKLNGLPSGSVVLFASPNNPVGNKLSTDDLKGLLTKHKDSLFIIDEAYFEYANDPATALLADHKNLMILRTFSKTMSLAGVRVGYIVAHSSYIDQLKKLRLPFLLNHFTVATLQTILTDSACIEHIKKTVEQTTSERDRLYSALAANASNLKIEVKPSEANFVLVRWPDDEKKNEAYQQLVRAGILVRDVSKGPMLGGCLRISVGTSDQNKALLVALGIPQ